VGKVVEHPVFQRLRSDVGKFNIKGKKLLIPDMAPFGARLFASCLRAFDVDAIVMETYKGLELGKEFTSGKECFPCQVTLGDILYFLRKERARLGSSFDPEKYVYFLPESDGPCRFGMYNKLQRLVLDRFPEFSGVRIAYLTTDDAYSTEGILPPEDASTFRKLGYVATIVADVFDRMTWRVRPYEHKEGITDEFMQVALAAMQKLVEEKGRDLPFDEMLDLVADTAKTVASFMDSHQPRRPRIGIVGEIYLRTHPASNQNLIREIEGFGGEVVDASVAEWINYVSYEGFRKLSRRLRQEWKKGNASNFFSVLRKWLGQTIEIAWQALQQKKVYDRVFPYLDIQPDHAVWTIERHLKRYGLFSFDIGTEAALSIGGAIEYIREGFDGIVNVFPFTCMPSTICSAILKPFLDSLRIPYLDVAYDGSIQPNREVAIRTFMYQAQQHRLQRGNRR